MKQIKFEYILVAIIFWLVLWAVNDYIAFLCTIVISFISLGVLVITLITQWIDHRPIPDWYYPLVLSLFLGPLIILLGYMILYDFDLAWMNE